VTTSGPHPPHRPERDRIRHARRAPARPSALLALLFELGIQPPGEPRFHLVSRWAAKHVWRVDVAGEPWAFVRYLLGSADQFPERWRHLRLGELLFEARVGPRILGMTDASEALGGRAAIIEAALRPISRHELEARAQEAIALFTRLHSNPLLHEALSQERTEADRRGLGPLARFITETHERWFEAVVPRWLEVGLDEINVLRQVVSELLSRLDRVEKATGHLGIVVPVHGDPNHGNFMVNRQGALRMIDFEELSLNNPVADLGVFLTWYVDTEHHRALLETYPLASPDAVLNRMRVWVPVRYLNIAAHWAARLTRAHDEDAWAFALSSVDEWLRSACELLYDGVVPTHLDDALTGLQQSLAHRGPLHPDGSRPARWR